MIWGKSSPSALSSLYSANHRILRIMTFAPFGNIDLKPIFEYLNILNLDQMILFELGKYLYKLNQNLLPPSTIGNYFTPDPFVNRHSYGLRSRTANIPTRLVCRTKFAEKSIQIGGLTNWSKIPPEIQNSTSLQIFKKSYKKFLFESSGIDDDDTLFFQ